VGTCIAKRNYRYFIMFLASILLSTVMLLINLIVYFLYRSSGSINQTAVIVVVVVVAAIIGIPILAFFIFHLYLAVTGNTTREVLKKLDKD
jgi:palmitoyltransferase ZDHHC9/14/18